MKNLKTQLLFTNALDKAQAEVKDAGGKITHILTESVFVAMLEEEKEKTVFNFSSPKPQQELDATSALMVNAWEAAEKKLKSTTKETKTHTHVEDKQTNGTAEVSANTSSSITAVPQQQMTGLIVVAVVVVGGPDNLKISPDEYNDIVTQIFAANAFLQSEGGDIADITFLYKFSSFVINASPNDSCSSIESCEAIFRDPALQQLGYSAGLKSCDDYITDLKNDMAAHSAYVTFITKYPVYKNAYASSTMACISYVYYQPKLTLEFLRMTCLLFGANFEGTNCTCKEGGVYNVPNNNCANCHSSFVRTTDCIMYDSNVMSLCPWTMAQIGWYNTKLAQGVPGIVCYNNNIYIAYRDATARNRISFLYYTPIKWVYENVSWLLEIPAASGDPRMCMDVQQSGVHIVFPTAGKNVWYLRYDGKNWTHRNLTSNGDVAPLAKGNPGIAQTADGEVVIVYRDVNDDIGVFHGGNTVWEYRNVSKAIFGEPKANGNPQIISYAGSYVNVVFPDDSGKIAFLTPNNPGGKWTYTDLTNAAAGAPQAVGDLSFIRFTNNSMFLVYRDVNNEIASLMWNGAKWYYDNISNLTKAPLAAGNPRIAQIGGNSGNVIYLVYCDTNNDVYCIVWEGEWTTYTNLTKAVSGVARQAGDPVVFSFENINPFVFYRDVNQQITEIINLGNSWAGSDVPL